MSSEEINDILSRLKGFDSKKQIIDLWYEISYLRNILGAVLAKIENKNDIEFTIDFFEKCVESAKQNVIEKFPDIGVTFTDTK